MSQKNSKIGPDFGHNGIASEDTANRSLPLDSPRRIRLFTTRNGVLTLILYPIVIGLKKREIGPDFDIAAQLAKIRPIGGYDWIPRVE